MDYFPLLFSGIVAVCLFGLVVLIAKAMLWKADLSNKVSFD